MHNNDNSNINTTAISIDSNDNDNNNNNNNNSIPNNVNIAQKPIFTFPSNDMNVPSEIILTPPTGLIPSVMLSEMNNSYMNELKNFQRLLSNIGHQLNIHVVQLPSNAIDVDFTVTTDNDNSNNNHNNGNDSILNINSDNIMIIAGNSHNNNNHNNHTHISESATLFSTTTSRTTNPPTLPTRKLPLKKSLLAKTKNSSNQTTKNKARVQPHRNRKAPKKFKPVTQTTTTTTTTTAQKKQKKLKEKQTPFEKILNSLSKKEMVDLTNLFFNKHPDLLQEYLGGISKSI